MKKLFCILLTLIMVLSLCACGGEGGGSAKADGLQVGFGRVNITPDYTVNLAGGDSASRISTGYQDYLYVTCVAITENLITYLVYTMDVICAEDVFVGPAKEAISESTGVPQEHILMNATHTHSGVAIRTSGGENVDTYRADFYKWATEAAEMAIADQSAAEVYYGSTKTDNMTFVRHYTLSNGSYAGANFGDFYSGSITGHATEADTELQLVKFARAAEDKKDIVMMSFPAHATFNQSNLVLSADFPGPARDYVEANTDTLVAYFIAAAGNQAPSSRIAGEAYSADYKAYGEELGRYAVETLSNLTKIEGSGVNFNSETFTAGYNKEKIDQLADAKKVNEVIKTYGKTSLEAKAAVAQYGFSSTYEAAAIVSRASAPDTNSMDINVISIGNLGFVFAPYEMFGTQAMYIKENSPCAMTFIVTCGEGAEGYLPDDLGWEMGSYESCVTKFERGTAEKVAEEFVSMLTDLKAAE